MDGVFPSRVRPSGLYPTVCMTSELSDAVYNQIQQLEEQKATLLRYDPTAGTRTTLDLPFTAGESLQIRLNVSYPSAGQAPTDTSQPRPPSMYRSAVARQRFTPGSSYLFTLDSTAVFRREIQARQH